MKQKVIICYCYCNLTTLVTKNCYHEYSLVLQESQHGTTYKSSLWLHPLRLLLLISLHFRTAQFDLQKFPAASFAHCLFFFNTINLFLSIIRKFVVYLVTTIHKLVHQILITSVTITRYTFIFLQQKLEQSLYSTIKALSY